MSLPSQPFTFRANQATLWPANSIGDSRLCHECAKLDLEQSFTRAHALYEGARGGQNSRHLQAYRSATGPAYLRHFHYVTSLNDRLSRTTHCKLCSFLRQVTSEPDKGTYKLLATCSSESYLFEPLKIDGLGKKERRS